MSGLSDEGDEIGGGGGDFNPRLAPPEKDRNKLLGIFAFFLFEQFVDEPSESGTESIQYRDHSAERYFRGGEPEVTRTS